MVQRYTEIPSTQKIRDSLQPILNNDKTALSCSAGTSFPSANIVEGMLCYRTDEKKLYQLIDVNNPKTGWVLIADLNGEFRHIEGGAIDYTAKDLSRFSSTTDCRNCKTYPSCGGGCYTSNTHEIDCFYYKTREELAKFWLEELEKHERETSRICEGLQRP